MTSFTDSISTLEIPTSATAAIASTYLLRCFSNVAASMFIFINPSMVTRSSTHSPVLGRSRVPPGQTIQTVDPLRDCASGGHSLHVESDFPVSVENFPGAQSKHADDPVTSLYAPAMHRTHSPPSGPVDPALHVHAVETELFNREFEFVGHVEHVEASVAPTAAENVPVPQSVHAADPDNALYFPATHSEHVSPSGPVDPALQVHVLPTSGA